MKHLLLLSFAVAAPAALLTGQTEQTIIDRAQQPAPPAAPSTPAPSSVAPGDADSGTQRIARPRSVPFKLHLAYDAQVYHTDNVNLVPSDQPGDHAVIVANTLAVRAEFASWAVGDGLLTPSVGFTYQRYHHGVGDNDHDDLDFDAYSLPLSLRYRFGANWEAALGFSASAIYSLEGPPDYHRIYRAYTPSLSLRKLIAFAPHRILAVGSAVSYSFTHSDRDSTPPLFSYRGDRNDKVDVSADIAYYHLHGKWTFGPYARLAYSDYAHYQEAAFNDVDRRDLTGSIGLAITYNFTPWCSARVFTNHDWRNPQGDSPVDYSYKTTNGGLGLTLSATF